MPGGNGHDHRLDSWKDIAAYLRRDVRTAIRWEKDKGLPVHRVPGGQRQAVFAYVEELEGWLRTESVRESVSVGVASAGDSDAGMTAVASILTASQDGPKLLVRDAVEIAPSGETPAGEALDGGRWIEGQTRAWAGPGRAYGMVLGFLLLFTLGVLARQVWLGVVKSHRAGGSAAGANIPTRAAFTGSELQVYDEMGGMMWAHRFPARVDISMFGGRLADKVRIADFRGDGQREVLAIVPLFTDVNASGPNRWELDLFSSGGQMLWSYVPRGKFQFGNHELDGPWTIVADYVSFSEGKARIWVGVVHAVWGNSFVETLDPVTLEETVRFVNTGVLHAINEITTPEGRYLIVGGFNNEPDTGSVAFIDERKPFAASPQTAGTRHKCVSCPLGDPDYYFVFPRSEINDLDTFHEASVLEVHVHGQEIEILKREMQVEGPPESVYLLQADHGVRVVSLRFESGYDMVHRQWETEGKLRHTLAECPERLHPRPIRMWTPAGGWTEIQLEAGQGN